MSRVARVGVAGAVRSCAVVVIELPDATDHDPSPAEAERRAYPHRAPPSLSTTRLNRQDRVSAAHRRRETRPSRTPAARGSAARARGRPHRRRRPRRRRRHHQRAPFPPGPAAGRTPRACTAGRWRPSATTAPPTRSVDAMRRTWLLGAIALVVLIVAGVPTGADARISRQPPHRSLPPPAPVDVCCRTPARRRRRRRRIPPCEAAERVRASWPPTGPRGRTSARSAAE